MAEERDILRRRLGLSPLSTPRPSAASATNPMDVRDPVTGLTPAQVAAQQALTEAVTAGAKLGIKTTTNVAAPGNVPTVSIVPTTATTTATQDKGTWVHDPSRTTENPDGSLNWFEYWSTDPSRTRTSIVRPQGFPGGNGNGFGASSDLAKFLAAQQAQNALAAEQAAAARAAQQKAERQSAFDLLFQQFSQYGLGGLVEPLRGLIESGVSPSEFTIRLRETDAYRKRFAANQARIQKGLRALSEAEYIGLEDQYQDVMRRYGLPDTYYARGDMGRQEGFERFIGGDVSPVELEDRIQTAQRRVINAAPEITASLRSFYPEIGQGDLLAYFLDPDKAIENIKRKVTAAEIGGAATMAGLATGATRAEELARYGVTGEAARQGFQTVASVLPRGSQLAEIYKQGPYTQTTAEQEVFGLAGAAEAGRQRRKLTELEQAAFSGQAGAAGGALARDRAGAF